MRAKLALAALAAWACGCGPVRMEGTEIVAIDTSASARQLDAESYSQAQRLLAQSLAEHVIVYRFDSKPAEIYHDEPFADEAEAGLFLKKNLKGDSSTRGTNLRKLFELVDREIALVKRPVRLTVFTDSGVELMTPEDDRRCRQISEAWQDKVEEVRFVGVRVGHREKLREIVAGPVVIE